MVPVGMIKKKSIAWRRRSFNNKVLKLLFFPLWFLVLDD